MFGECIFLILTSDLQLNDYNVFFLFGDNYWEAICWANIYLSVPKIFQNVNFLQCKILNKMYNIIE